MTTIRPARAGDVGVVLELIRALAKHHGQSEYVRSDQRSLLAAGFGDGTGPGALIAEVDGNAVGYLSYTIAYSIWLGDRFMQIDDVFIRDEYRGEGLGETLMTESQRTCRALGLSRIKWEVEPDNAAAIRFYERLGANGYDKRLFSWNVDKGTAE